MMLVGMLIVTLMLLLAMLTMEMEVNLSIYYSFCQNLEFERRFGASNSGSRPLSS